MSEQASLGHIAYDALYDLYPGSNHTPWEQLGEGDGLKVEIEAQAQAVAAHVRAESEARIAAIEAALSEIIAMEDKAWKPMRVFRSEHEAELDEAKHQALIEAADVARAALKGGSK